MPEPAPTKNDLRPIWEQIIKDMYSRDNLGLSRYGMRLQAFNGRDALQDLKEELLDGLAYLTQIQEETKTEYVIQVCYEDWQDFEIFEQQGEMKKIFIDDNLDCAKYRMIERKTLIMEIKP